MKFKNEYTIFLSTKTDKEKMVALISFLKIASAGGALHPNQVLKVALENQQAALEAMFAEAVNSIASAPECDTTYADPLMVEYQPPDPSMFCPEELLRYGSCLGSEYVLHMEKHYKYPNKWRLMIHQSCPPAETVWRLMRRIEGALPREVVKQLEEAAADKQYEQIAENMTLLDIISLKYAKANNINEWEFLHKEDEIEYSSNGKKLPFKIIQGLDRLVDLGMMERLLDSEGYLRQNTCQITELGCKFLSVIEGGDTVEMERLLESRHFTTMGMSDCVITQGQSDWTGMVDRERRVKL